MSEHNGAGPELAADPQDVIALLADQVGRLSAELAIRDSVIGRLRAELAGRDEAKNPAPADA